MVLDNEPSVQIQGHQSHSMAQRGNRDWLDDLRSTHLLIRRCDWMLLQKDVGDSFNELPAHLGSLESVDAGVRFHLNDHIRNSFKVSEAKPEECKPELNEEPDQDEI